MSRQRSEQKGNDRFSARGGTCLLQMGHLGTRTGGIYPGGAGSPISFGGAPAAARPETAQLAGQLAGRSGRIASASSRWPSAPGKTWRSLPSASIT